MPSEESIAEAFIRDTLDWANARRDADGGLNPGVLGTAISVSELLRKYWPLSQSVVDTGSQIRGQGGPAVGRILARYGERRKFLSEGGRTSRKSRPYGIELGSILTKRGNALGYSDFSVEAKNRIVDNLQRALTELTQNEFFNRQRLTPEVIDPNYPITETVSSIMNAAIARRGTVAGAVAQHLVGAVLQHLYPYDSVGQDSYTTADVQTARAGDFAVGSSAFHVTMAPAQALFDKCRKNLSDGYRPIVLVPDRLVAAAIQIADISGVKDRVAVLSIESFVALNIEQLGHFDIALIRPELRNTLRTYNDRIMAIEADLSLMIEIPERL